jgi:hypothetical protein
MEFDQIPDSESVAAMDGVMPERSKVIPLSHMSQCTAARSVIKLTLVMLAPQSGVARTGAVETGTGVT